MNLAELDEAIKHAKDPAPIIMNFCVKEKYPKGCMIHINGKYYRVEDVLTTKLRIPWSVEIRFKSRGAKTCIRIKKSLARKGNKEAIDFLYQHGIRWKRN